MANTTTKQQFGRVKRKLTLGALSTFGALTAMLAIAPLSPKSPDRLVSGDLSGDRISLPSMSLATTAAHAQDSAALNLQWLGHMSFLINGNGNTILTHPFKPAGCTAFFPEPKKQSDLVLISSRLLDEGYVTNLEKQTKLLYQPGAYSLINTNFQGIRMDHDRIGGKRFGMNVAWRWEQSGVSVLHLGGAAAPLAPDQRILIGRPDVLIIPIGGGPKSYNAQEAAAVVNSLNPKLVIPTYYRTRGANANCELGSIDDFLAQLPNTPVRQVGSSNISITSGNLPQATTIAVLTPPATTDNNSQDQAEETEAATLDEDAENNQTEEAPAE
ncbi:hypothetical protein Pse7367_3189 [Thalassoporum mexicanum PCC 7367]|uniref:MBL fold metallo-hydrolase n=1 Tax=Thalassoporum mexicanum TaxID=3457544 RepID=UPI00029F9507|nr:MBL fold metallo-hydrolase [Pseudanabaena sp. PCC 7367]AFY71437.1 hypothetical protein Pse7367_3189 [Pseudanabaena sp. PCC 7367]